MCFIVSFIVQLLIISQASGFINDLSFEPPFEQYDFTGSKLVNSNWKNHGTTVVNKNFVRLTPDRQSKKGALWSRSPLSTESLHAILKFRISGQGAHSIESTYNSSSIYILLISQS